MWQKICNFKYRCFANDSHTYQHLKCSVRVMACTRCIFEQEIFFQMYKSVISGKKRTGRIQASYGMRSVNPPYKTHGLYRWTTTDLKHYVQYCLSVQTSLLFQNLIITLQKSPSIFFWRHSWFVPDSSKLDSAHLSYKQGFVVQFPRNTRSFEFVSNLNFTRPLKSQVFSAFEPVEQIGKLCSPAKNRPKPRFCSEKSLPSARC